MSTNATPTVAEIAAGSLEAVRVFEKFGIDYCCGGKRPLDEVCREKGISAADVKKDLETALNGKPSAGREWEQAPLRDLIAHIIETHHEYLKLELPRLSDRMNKVARVHGPKDPATFSELPGIFEDMRAELEMHMRKEEIILFPSIERYEAAFESGQPLPQLPFGSLRNPIAMMESEHQGAGDALVRMRQLTKGYQVPDYACPTFRALWKGLEEVEHDLHRHIHLENNILFPRAIAMEG